MDTHIAHNFKLFCTFFYFLLLFFFFYCCVFILLCRRNDNILNSMNHILSSGYYYYYHYWRERIRTNWAISSFYDFSLFIIDKQNHWHLHHDEPRVHSIAQQKQIMGNWWRASPTAQVVSSSTILYYSNRDSLLETQSFLSIATRIDWS